jgi:hypothetical protein
MSKQLPRWLVLLFVSIFAVIAVVLSLGLTTSGSALRSELSVPFKVNPDLALRQVVLPAETTVETLKMKTVLTDSTGSDYLWIILWRIPPLILGIIGVFLLWKVVRTLAAGDPFNAANTRRLRIMTVLFLMVPFLDYLGDFAKFQLLEGITVSLPVVSPEVNFGPLLIAIVPLLLSEAFAQGHRARKDVEGFV